MPARDPEEDLVSHVRAFCREYGEEAVQYLETGMLEFRQKSAGEIVAASAPQADSETPVPPGASSSSSTDPGKKKRRDAPWPVVELNPWKQEKSRVAALDQSSQSAEGVSWIDRRSLQAALPRSASTASFRDFEPGQEWLFYRFERKLFEDDLGVVYVAEDRRSELNRRVVLRLLFEKADREAAIFWNKERLEGLVELIDFKYIEEEKVFLMELSPWEVHQCSPEDRFRFLIDNLPGIAETLAYCLKKGFRPRFSFLIKTDDCPDFPSFAFTGPFDYLKDSPLHEWAVLLAQIFAELRAWEHDDTVVGLPGWLRNLLERCLGQAEPFFDDVDQAVSWIRFCSSPEKSFQIRLKPSLKQRVDHLKQRISYQIDYQVEVNGTAHPRFFRSPAPESVVEGLKASWQALQRIILRRTEYEAHGIEDNESQSEIRRQLEGISSTTEILLGTDLKELIESREFATVTLEMDHDLIEVPWELLDVDGPLCLRFPFSRTLRSENPNLGISRADNGLSVLVIFEPELETAVLEANTLKEVFDHEKIDCVLVPADEGPVHLRSALCSHSIIHFAGHGSHDLNAAGGVPGGWKFRGTDIFEALELDAHWRKSPPALVFANACYSGRFRTPKVPDFASDAAFGFAQNALAVGVRSFIGSFLEIPEDARVLDFPVHFYQRLVESRVVSQAVWEARKHCWEKHGADHFSWGLFCLFGDAFFRLNDLRPPIRDPRNNREATHE